MIAWVPFLPSSTGPKTPGTLTPSLLSVLPAYWPWLDSTRPIAAISSHGTLQVVSAASMICAARWYAERAADGMPLVEAPATVASAAPLGTAGAIAPGIGTLAGALIAWLGTALPSGRPLWWFLAAEATLSAPAMLAVQAAESRASGTSDAALLLRPLSFADIRRVSPGQ